MVAGNLCCTKVTCCAYSSSEIEKDISTRVRQKIDKIFIKKGETCLVLAVKDFAIARDMKLLNVLVGTMTGWIISMYLEKIA